MAMRLKLAEGPNRCDILEQPPNKPAVTKLQVFGKDTSVPDTISQTAAYGKYPEIYLESLLGNTALDAKRHLLSVPTKIDRDYYGSGEHKTNFQNHIAKLLGKEHGLFFITGVQAQLIAMKIHCENAKNNRVAWHVTSHLESAEEKAYSALYGLERVLVGSDPNELPTVDEIQKVLSLPTDQRPAVLLIEVPNRVLGCQTYTFDELKAISTACKDAGIKFHCDGARLWEIEPYYQSTAGKSFAEISTLFDSVYVSFYKGLRGACGAMLVSNSQGFMNEAKVWQRRVGGNAFQLTYEVVDCERGFNENIGTFKKKWDKMDDVVKGITAATSRFKVPGTEQQVVRFWPEKATCCQIRTVFQGYTADELLAARDRVEERLNVRPFERLWSKQTLDEKSAADRAGKSMDEIDKKMQLIEWMIGESTLRLEKKVFVDAYVALCEELAASP